TSPRFALTVKRMSAKPTTSTRTRSRRSAKSFISDRPCRTDSPGSDEQARGAAASARAFSDWGWGRPCWTWSCPPGVSSDRRDGSSRAPRLDGGSERDDREASDDQRERLADEREAADDERRAGQDQEVGHDAHMARTPRVS